MSTVSRLYDDAAGSDTAKNAKKTLDAAAREARDGLDRARDFAADAYDEAHEASKDYPHVTVAVALGLGFALGVLAMSRR